MNEPRPSCYADWVSPQQQLKLEQFEESNSCWLSLSLSPHWKQFQQLRANCMLCTCARPGWKTNGNWQLTTGSQPNFDNWLKTKLTLLCIKVSKSPFCLGHHAAQSSDATWYGHLEIKCWKLPKHFPCHWAWQEGHPKSQSKASTKDPYLRTAYRSWTDAKKIPTWIMDVNIKGRTNERILREHVQRIWGSQWDCLRVVE